MIEYDAKVTLQFLLSVAVIVFTWWRTRDQNTAASFTAASARMDRHEQRLNSIEQTVRNLPARDDMHGLNLALSDLKGELKAMRAEMAGTTAIMSRVEDVVSRHEQHLMDSKR